MHHCLLISEIVHLICEHASLSSLAALARTCCFFHDPALTVLWRDIPSITPLLMCFPIGLVYPNGGQLWSKNRPILMLKRPFIPSDWSRFSMYASRVQTLGFSHEANIVDPRVHECLIHTMTFASKGAKLLPNVCAVSWNVPYGGEDFFSLVQQILTPNLTRLEIHVLDNWMIRRPLLPILVEMPLKIEHVTLVAVAWGNQNRTAISSAVCKWTILRTLEVNDLSYEGFTHIASLPSLRKLTVKDLSYVERMESSAKSGFPALRRLTLTSLVMENCIGLLQLMSNTPLSQFICTFKRHSRSIVWQELFSTIRQNGSLIALRDVYLKDEKHDQQHFQNPNRLTEGECVLSVEHISPLFTFNMKSVVLRPSAGFSLKPNDLCVIATSWPYISRLTLGTGAPTSVPAGIKLCDLSVLAKHCPKLKKLALKLDTTPLPATDTGRGVYKGMSLGLLHVGDSSISHSPLDVAEHLQEMFPNLAIVETLDGDKRRRKKSTAPRTQLEDQWCLVMEHLRRCSSDKLAASKQLNKTAESNEPALTRLDATATLYDQS
ncbi:hypothetical protein BDQ12DRAFT_715125 [Crucibulum laeve]|uniref:F-box domain-containing protein n=1 Tax=Crucibulum laeve TaxID=68775 RepID=A0A5C3LQD8_9AGAR|nr:hypothetical protein BDQ12DRAFT_715125 [Crucibulum laeve]